MELIPLMSILFKVLVYDASAPFHNRTLHRYRYQCLLVPLNCEPWYIQEREDAPKFLKIIFLHPT